MTAPATSPDRRIVMARFGTPDGASAALTSLKNGGVRLGNVAHVTQNAAGEVNFSETQDWGIGKSALVGALAAAVLPGIGLLAGAAAGAVAAHFIDLGFPDPLLKQAGSSLLAPGQSLLVALVQVEDTAHAEQLVGTLGGTLLASGTERDLESLMARARGA